MSMAPNPNRSRTPRVLHAYLLGRLRFDEWLALQRPLGLRRFRRPCQRRSRTLRTSAYDFHRPRGQRLARLVGTGRSRIAELAVMLGESRRRLSAVRARPDLLLPDFALDRLELTVQNYLDRLQNVVRNVLTTIGIAGEVRAASAGVWVGDRQIAHVGVAVRDWITSFGCALNVEPNLKLFRNVQCDGDARSMTSIERERRARVRPAAIRQRLLAEFVEQFGFDRVALLHHHPALTEKAVVHAVAAYPG